jgi:hypothetical protein
MVFENLHVKHKSFGNGIILSKSGKYITVKFGTAQKIFVYPDIFEKFLTLEDGSVSDDILADIKDSNLAKQRIIDIKNEENHRAMTRGIVIPGKENANLDGEDEEHSSSEHEEI